VFTPVTVDFAMKFKNACLIEELIAALEWTIPFFGPLTGRLALKEDGLTYVKCTGSM
jgi:hypothetical protein